MQDFTNTKAVIVGNGHLITRYLRGSLLIQTRVQSNTCEKGSFAGVIFAGCFTVQNNHNNTRRSVMKTYPQENSMRNARGTVERKDMFMQDLDMLYE